MTRGFFKAYSEWLTAHIRFIPLTFDLAEETHPFKRNLTPHQQPLHSQKAFLKPRLWFRCGWEPHEQGWRQSEKHSRDHKPCWQVCLTARATDTSTLAAFPDTEGQTNRRLRNKLSS